MTYITRESGSDTQVGPDLLTWVNLDAIRGRRFTRARRGYAQEEVEAFRAGTLDLFQRLVAERDVAVAEVEREKARTRESELARVMAETALSYYVSRGQASEARGEALEPQFRALPARVAKFPRVAPNNGHPGTAVRYMLRCKFFSLRLLSAMSALGA